MDATARARASEIVPRVHYQLFLESREVDLFKIKLAQLFQCRVQIGFRRQQRLEFARHFHRYSILIESGDCRIEKKVFNLGREELVVARWEAGAPEQILLDLVQATKEPREMEVRPEAEEIQNLLNSSIRILRIAHLALDHRGDSGSRA
jgi:hypothetical protein